MRHLVIVAAVLAVPPPAKAQVEKPAFDLAPYVQPARMVDVGGRRMNLLCLGRGQPTVVFEAQLGEAAWDWAPVHAQVSQHTRACIYDRAGIGFSDPSQRPGTAANAAQDLADLLGRAGEDAPYLLVGASYGALVVRYFAARHRHLVSGLVLVDGHHEDEFARIDQLSAGRYGAMMASVDQSYRACAAAARSRIAPGSAEYRACVSPPPAFANRALAAAHLSQLLSATYWASALSEWEHLNSASAAQARSVKAELRDIPILALVRSISPFTAPGRPQSSLSVAVEREHARMQEETASLSASGTTRVVPDASHAMHLDNPGAVAQAIRDTIARTRR